MAEKNVYRADAFIGVKHVWSKVKKKTREAYEWCVDHKDVILAVVPVLISGAFELAKAKIYYRNRVEERELEAEKMCSVYDEALGVRLDTIRPLTNDDARKMQSLMDDDGLTTLKALDKMGLLS